MVRGLLYNSGTWTTLIKCAESSELFLLFFQENSGFALPQHLGILCQVGAWTFRQSCGAGMEEREVAEAAVKAGDSRWESRERSRRAVSGVVRCGGEWKSSQGQEILQSLQTVKRPHPGFPSRKQISKGNKEDE